MKCPKCGSNLRPSKKNPGYYLCDTCKKRYHESTVIQDTDAPVKRRSSKKRKKKKQVKKLLLLILLFVALIGCIVGAFFINKSKKEKAAAEKARIEKEKEKENIYQIGSTAKIKDIEVEILEYNVSSGDDWAAPADGNEFIYVNIKIQNNSDESLTVTSMSNFENYCDGKKLEYSADSFTSLAASSDKKQIDGSISSGESLEGYLCLEAPSDWKKIEIHYLDNVWASEPVIFEIEK